MSELPEGFRLERRVAFDLPSAPDALAQLLPWEQRTIRVYGRESPVPRLTAWFGRTYTYSGIVHAPAPIPGWLAAVGARFGTFDSVLGNYYRDGSDSVAWHADDEPELGSEPTIASVSLGATRAFSVRPADQTDSRRWKVDLRHGDVLIMSGRSQLDYRHSVPRTARPVGPRVNLTFRRIG